MGAFAVFPGLISSSRSADGSSSLLSGLLSSSRNLLIQARHRSYCSPQQRALQRRAGVCVWPNRSLPPLPPVLQSSPLSSPSSVVSLLNMSNDVVISVSLHLSMSDGKQECVAHARVRACAAVVVTDEENGCGQPRMRSALVPGGCWDEMNRSGPRTRPCVRACVIHRHHYCQTGLKLCSLAYARPIMQIRAVRRNISQSGSAWMCVGLSQPRTDSRSAVTRKLISQNK